MTQISRQSYYQQTFRRVFVVLLIIIVVAAILIGTSIVREEYSNLRLLHTSVLDELELQLETQLNQYIQEASDIANDPNVRTYSESPGGTFAFREVSNTMSTILNRHLDTYDAIRFITPDAITQIEFLNEDGKIRAGFDRVGIEDTILSADANFDEMRQGKITDPIISDLRLRLNPQGIPLSPPEPYFSIYAPIYETIPPSLNSALFSTEDTITVYGIIVIEVNAIPIIDLVSQSPILLSNNLPDREILLFHPSGNLLVESSASNLDYLTSIAIVDEIDSQYINHLDLIQSGQTEEQRRLVFSSEGDIGSANTVSLDTPVNGEWELLIIDATAIVFSGIYLAITGIVITSVLVAIASLVVLRLLLRPLLTPADALTTQLEQLATQQFGGSLPATQSDHLAKLADQIKTLDGDLANQRRQRQRDIQVAGRISRESAILSNLDELLKQSINLICNELGFYHAQVFLLDSARLNAVLVHSRGEVGQQLVEKQHSLAINSQSVVGTTARTSEIVIVNDTDNDTTGLHGFNPLLPETRAEMGIPLIIGAQVIGVLDIQSKSPNVFDNADLPLYQLVADQLAIAVHNTRLKTEADQQIKQVSQLNRQLTRDAWEKSQQEEQYKTAFTYNLMEVAPTDPQKSIPNSLVTPIKIRGQVVGTLEAAVEDNRSLAESDEKMLQSVADRVAIALENARLFEQTQSSLSETSVLYQVGNKLNEAISLEEILSVIIDSVTPEAKSSQLWLFDEYLMGEIPQFAQLTTEHISSDTSIVYPEQHIGSRFRFSMQPLFIRLTGNTPTFIENAQKHPDFTDKLLNVMCNLPQSALVFIPLSMRGLWRGFILLEFEPPYRLTERDERIMRALIDQAGSAINNQLLLQQTEEALSRNEKLYAASRIINTTQNLQDLVYAVVATSADPTLNFWLGLLQGTTDPFGWSNQVHIIAKSDGGRVEAVDEVHPLIVADDSPIRNREPEILDLSNLSSNTSQLARWLQEEGQQFAGIFPLFSDNRPIALFFIVSELPHKLSQEDNETYRALTGQMSTQIENRRLLEQTERALDETRRLFIASRAIITAPNTEEIYQEVVTQLAVPYTHGHEIAPILTFTIFTAHPEPKRSAQHLKVDYHWSTEQSMEHIHAVGELVSHEALPFGSLVEESENALFYPDIHVIPPSIVDIKFYLQAHDTQSAVVASLQTRSRWFGVLICRTNTLDLFDEGYVRYAQALADQAAIALENNYLLHESQQERQNLRSILSTLPAGVLVLDPETYQPVTTNEQIESLLGQAVDFDKPFAASHYDLYRTGTNIHYPDEDLPIYQAQKLGKRFFSDDVAVIKNGQETDLMVNAAPIFDSTDKMIAIVAAFSDISNLRNLENTLQENLRETVALYETQRALAEADTLEDVLDVVIVQMSMIQPDDAYIILVDDVTQQPMLMRELIGSLPTIEPLQPILSEDAIYLEDIQIDINPELRSFLEEREIRSIIVQPLRLRSGDQPAGWFVAVAKRPDAFTLDQERMLVTLGDIAMTAIDNRFLFQSTQRALQEATSLYMATTSVSRSRDLDELYRAIESSISTLTPNQFAGFIFNDGEWQIIFSRGFRDDNYLPDLIQRLPIETMDAYGAYYDNVATSDIKDDLRHILSASSIASVAFVNLRIKGTLGGQLLIAYHEPHQFTSGEQRFLSTLSDSASVVINNQLLLEQIQNTLQETSVLYQASRALTQATSSDEVLQVVVNYLIDSHVDHVFIALLNRPSWDDPAAAADVVASWNTGDGIDLLNVSLTPDQFPAWNQLAAKTVEPIDNIHTSNLNEAERAGLESLNAQSLVIIPLRIASRAIGAIWIGSQNAYTYQQRDIRVFQAFAEQASLSFEAAYLFAQTERRARQLATSAAVSQQAGQILDMDILLPQVVNLIRDQFGYDHVQIFLMDNRDEYAELRASTGEAGRQLLGIKHKLAKGSDSVIGQVAANNQPTIALDTADASVVHRPNPYLPMTRSEMAIPLVIKGEVVGALDVQSNQPNAFNEEDLQALTTLAAQISVAIDNASLYEDAANRAADMSFLFEITTSAAAADTLEGALQTVAERVHEAINLHAIVLYIPKSYVDLSDNIYKQLVPAAAAGIDHPLDGISEVGLNNADSLISLVGSTLQPQIIPDIEHEMRYISIAPDSASAGIVPISSGSELVGVIVVESKEIRAFSLDTLQLLQTLAGSLAAIIQNRTLVDQLQETNEQLREVDRLKSQFLANMSHELRTPLNSIIGFSRVMLKGIDGELTEMQEQDLTTIYNSGQHLLNLINDILDQAKIEGGKLDLKFAYFEVKPMIESVKSIGIGLVKDKTIKLRVDVAPNLPQAYGDEFRTRQILLNLVSNAVKFTPVGEVNVRAYQVQDVNEKVFIRIDVTDTGIGIEEKDMPLLFETFRQVDSSLTRTVGGTGLGLPISKSLAEMQGGELTVSSELNIGSTFTVTVPVEPTMPEADDTPEPAQENGSTQPAQNGKNTPNETRSDLKPPPAHLMTQAMPVQAVKREILLIEDNKDMVDQFRRSLQREGFDVQTADHPAYAEAMASNLRPNVIIMDVNFANGEGWNILKNLKDRDDTFDIPIIVSTMSDESERAFQIGAYQYIQRPFMPEDMIEIVLKAEKESNRERILIIDDQPESIRLLTQLLNEHGSYRVFSAENGVDGISLVARRKPDLIILDLRMPDMDGFAVLNELRANPETSEIPVMVVTGDINLDADEQERLSNIRILYKTDISQEAYDQFIQDVKSALATDNGSMS